MTSVCFFTVCGGGEDYEFLLGSIRHHAEMGRHVVLDTTPKESRRTFVNLPDSVIWIYDPEYGSGWDTFNYRAAVKKGAALAKWSGAAVTVCLDCDEFFAGECEKLFQMAEASMIAVETVHWKKDGHAYRFGSSEFHRRLWPSSMDVSFPVNKWWVKSPHYNGNPNHHALPMPPQNARAIDASGAFHNHVHYALGKKSDDDSTARASIDGWPNGTLVSGAPRWPALLARWRDEGALPSAEFL